MRYMISRTRGGEPPCDGAFRAAYVRVDERGTDAPDKIPYYVGKDSAWWFSEGRNHRVEDGHIKRNFDDEAWFVEIEDLAALQAFIGDQGQIVMGPAWRAPSIIEIEIYDDYRE
jgi:hypothetical protein